MKQTQVVEPCIHVLVSCRVKKHCQCLFDAVGNCVKQLKQEQFKWL